MARQSRWHLMMPERIGFIVMVIIFSLVCIPTLWYQYQSSKLAHDLELRYFAVSIANVEEKSDSIVTEQEKPRTKVKTKEVVPQKQRQHLDQKIPTE